jgi:hypothetical protein
MYHDQGLPVLKYATFGHGVNITLGLPLIRTSVDHGTALDLARTGLGRADCGSMEQAISAWLWRCLTNFTINMMKHVARKRFGQNFLHDQHVLGASPNPSTRRRTTPWSKSAPAWAP